MTPTTPARSLGSAVYVQEGIARELELDREYRVWLTAAEIEVSDGPPLVAVSVHAPTQPSVRPFIDLAFEALRPLLAGRSFVVVSHGDRIA